MAPKLLSESIATIALRPCKEKRARLAVITVLSISGGLFTRYTTTYTKVSNYHHLIYLKESTYPLHY